MLSRQHSQTTSTVNRPISNQNEIPDYFTVSTDYDVIPVGHKFNTHKIANETGYDCYILAGIEENELFSKLLIMNMNVSKGIAFDPDFHKISEYFPEDIKVVNKQISFKKDMYCENLSDLGEEKDVFLKMNIYGEEYLWILSLPEETQKKFKQMVIVFHDINNNSTQQRAMNKINCFQKLKKTHDIVNITPVNQDIVVTYFRKDSRNTNKIASTHISQEIVDIKKRNFYTSSDDENEEEIVSPRLVDDETFVSNYRKFHQKALEKINILLNDHTEIQKKAQSIFDDLLLEALSQEKEVVIETAENTEPNVILETVENTETDVILETVEDTEQEVSEDIVQDSSPTFSDKPKSKNAKRAAKQRAAKKTLKFDDVGGFEDDTIENAKDQLDHDSE